MSTTRRLTVAQALVEVLAVQHVERDGVEQPLLAGVLGIFGHGNVAGLGQALLEHELAAVEAGRRPRLPYVLARNEQAMVHTAVAYARQRDRLQVWACTASVGPGSSNMLTGAALATINRLPVLLLPSGTFATRRPAPVLQELEHPGAGDLGVNDAFRPLSRYTDEVHRPEALPAALLGALRVLTDPVATGAVTLSLPQDVQAQAHDWPAELFEPRVWHVPRPPAEPAQVARAAALVRAARRPLLVAGGGVHHSGAEDALAAFAARTGIPVAETQSGKGSLLHGHPRLMGGIGATGTPAANALAREADLVIGVGTRWSDFTTASRTAFAHPQVRVVNLGIDPMDVAKLSGLPLLADAREGLVALDEALAGWTVEPAYRQEQEQRWAAWDEQVRAASAPAAATDEAAEPRPLTQVEVLGVLNEHTGPRDVVVCAAGSMPGELHRLWRVRERRAYHVEYGYSCMGYEIPAAIGVRWADDTREVLALVGDGGYLMMPTELVTAVQERTKVIVVLVDNGGFGSIGALSEQVGSQRFGTRYRRRDDRGRLEGEPLPVDLAANARSLGAQVIEAADRAGLVDALARARAAQVDVPVVIHVRTDPLATAPGSDAWWDVEVAEVSTLGSTRAARAAYETERTRQRPHLAPASRPAGEPQHPGWDG